MNGRLILLAHGRSGDKGNAVNIGVIARRPEFYDVIRKALSCEVVAEHLKSLAAGPVQRYELPNLGALNFLVHNALDGGGSLSLRLDAQGKTYAQALLRMPVAFPAELVSAINEAWSNDVPSEFVIKA